MVPHSDWVSRSCVADKAFDKKPADDEPSGGKCLDEVGCLLADNPPACCKKYGGGGDTSYNRGICNKFIRFLDGAD